MVETTNSPIVEQFIRELNEQLNLENSVIILDNHRAHWSESVKSITARCKCELMFLPPVTSIFNPIETFWAHVKRKWRKLLQRYDPSKMGRNWMIHSLEQICYSFPRD